MQNRYSEFVPYFKQPNTKEMIEELKNHDSFEGKLYPLIKSFSELVKLINKLDLIFFKQHTQPFLKYLEILLVKVTRCKNESLDKTIREIQTKFDVLKEILSNFINFKQTMEIYCHTPKKDEVYIAAKNIYQKMCLELLPFFSSLDSDQYINLEKIKFINSVLKNAALAIKFPYQKNNEIQEHKEDKQNNVGCSSGLHQNRIAAKRFLSYKKILTGMTFILTGVGLVASTYIGFSMGIIGIVFLPVGGFVVFQEVAESFYYNIQKLLVACEQAKVVTLTSQPLISSPRQINTKLKKHSFIPNKLCQADLKDGQLYSNDEVKKIHEYTETKEFTESKVKRIKKADLKQIISDAKWDVICYKRRGSTPLFFTVYKGKAAGHLGKGQYAFVKLVQHAHTKEFCVIKIIEKNKSYTIADYNKEVEALKSAGQYIYSYSRKNKWGVMQYEIIMKLAPGLPLEKFINDNTIELTPCAFFDLLMNLAEGIQNLHNKKIIHTDLNPNNYMIHQESGSWITTPIDFGLAQLLQDSSFAMYVQKYYENISYHTAPEIARNVYSPKSDIYSLGILYSFLLGFEIIKSNGKIKLNPQYINPGHGIKLSEKDREDLTKFINFINKKMLTHDLYKRASASEIVNFLKELREPSMAPALR